MVHLIDEALQLVRIVLLWPAKARIYKASV
jgi:hypothetical protein